MDIQALHKRLEELGVELVKNDLSTRAYRYVGGSPEVREEAWKWVQEQEAKSNKIIGSSFSYYGFTVNFRELWLLIKKVYARALVRIKHFFMNSI
jgi:hypothetical protein